MNKKLINLKGIKQILNDPELKNIMGGSDSGCPEPGCWKITCDGQVYYSACKTFVIFCEGGGTFEPC